MGGYSDKCPICGKWFTDPRGWRDHIKSHAEEIERLKANRDAERHRADAFEREVASLRAELEQAQEGGKGD